jgi:late competence protein required for DNA uptake (superfamily II DNA/RNA helicase)
MEEGKLYCERCLKLQLYIEAEYLIYLLPEIYNIYCNFCIHNESRKFTYDIYDSDDLDPIPPLILHITAINIEKYNSLKKYK